MSAIPPSETGAAAASTGVSSAEIDASCRMPLLVLFISAAVWLLVGSAFALIASIKFHAPEFLAKCACLTYGRVQPAGWNSMLYGFGLQAGLGVALWMLSRLARVRLAQGWLATTGAVFWNLGVTAGVLGILAGDSTGFQSLEMPVYSVPFVFLGTLMISLPGLITFYLRRERSLYVSQWFIFTALFWFPWIYSTAVLLLVKYPVRGVMQAVIAWWYADNLLVVWLGLVGLAAVFYFIPKLTKRELHSRYLALFTFWMLLLAGTWGGIPKMAPVPAWMPAWSTVATAMLLLPLLTVGLAVYRTLDGKCSALMAHPSLRFIGAGAASFILAGLMKIVGAVLDVGQVLHFTWFGAARNELQFYGFFAMVMFGAVYYIAPRITGLEFPRPGLVRAHFGLALAGVLFEVVPLALGGVVEGFKLKDPAIAFVDVFKATLPFLRASTLGLLLIALGHVLFFLNLAGLAKRLCSVRAASALAEATVDLFKTAGAKQ